MVVERELKKICDRFRTQGIKPSIPNIAANFLISQSLTLTRLYAEELIKYQGLEEKIRFLAFYDFFFGVNLTANLILLAEASNRGNLEDVLGYQSEKKANLLEMDPIVKSVLNSLVQSLRDGSMPLPEYMVRFFTLEGARFVPTSYEFILPLAEKCLKSPPKPLL